MQNVETAVSTFFFNGDGDENRRKSTFTYVTKISAKRFSIFAYAATSF